MIIGTAGHIDHGKTALIKALTGMDADRLPEEKARGITIDLGYAFYPLPHGAVLGFIDVPGHERFVHNMLAGATGIDFVLLVVAADDGVMPQTREHMEIIDLLGVKRGAVALTKIDRVEAARSASSASRRRISREATGYWSLLCTDRPRGSTGLSSCRHPRRGRSGTGPRCTCISAPRRRWAASRCCKPRESSRAAVAARR